MLLSIEKLIYGGEGLARTPAGADGRSMAVFVPFVLPGERVDADLRPERSGFARASVTEWLEASPDRVAAHCPYFQKCGGCHYQHIPYPRQLEFKAAILRETLQRIAKIELPCRLQLHASPAWGYRNRIRLRVRTSPEFSLGYFRFGSHEFLPVSECPIASPLLNRVMASLLKLGGLNCPPAVEEIELFADASYERLLVWAFCRREAEKSELLRWAEAVRRELPEIVGATFFSSTSSQRPNQEEDAPMDRKALAQSGAKSIRYRTKDHEYRVSAGAFFQVNRYLLDELVAVVTANASGESALDLYAGVGLFSAVLAGNFHHILSVEASQTAYGDLVQNVPANVKAVRGRTEDSLTRDYSNGPRKEPDLVVLDPPRTGAGKSVTRALVKMETPRVRYVSCDPATLARDLEPLLAGGYRIAEAHLFDLFPQTFHIESVMLLER